MESRDGIVAFSALEFCPRISCLDARIPVSITANSLRIWRGDYFVLRSLCRYGYGQIPKACMQRFPPR
ncbi:hypothetical protein N658DRAFT_52466 [Parathielavia hyrcaniae]|uniref:Uncharacterized protein n=1 Tax=Parathielavia hyrcaniae TaxID=113614 RepID=A0AAN6T2J9_9PEZI|nr:hypothetical protein N658DRAFT_52466 [Parathielavia hyrcaniae]